MSELTLVAKKRESGKQAAKQYRNRDLVPGVFYRKDLDNINIVVEKLDMRPIVYSDVTRVFMLDVEGKKEKCVLKDIDFDPVTDEIVHFDLLGLKEDEEVTIRVPFKFKGQAKGIVTGGQFRQVLRKVSITALPANLVEFFEIDITELNIGDTLYIRDLDTENLEFDVTEDTAICMVSRPRVVTEIEEGEGEEGEEGAEGAEGEEGADSSESSEE